VNRWYLDANVLLRLVLADPPEQSLRAAELMTTAARGESELILDGVTVVEVAVVLCRTYGFDRQQCAGVLKDLCQAPGLVVDPDLLKGDFFGELADTTLDPADVFLLAKSRAGHVPIATFDKKLRSRSGSKPI
jgi:predicted nucleic acid-binding protein